MSDISAAIRLSHTRRGSFHNDPTQTAYRLFHGYAEGCVGLTIDRFGDVILAAYRADVEDQLAEVASALARLHPGRTVIAKAHRSVDDPSEALRVRALQGQLPSEPVLVRDNGLLFATTPHADELNGLFLDARDARRWILEHARDRRILNLFAYTGSLGVAAAAGGARRVTHVDSKHRPLTVARQNHQLNDQPVDDRAFVHGDVYDHLPRAAKAGATFDGIVLDPPPQVPRRGRRRDADGQDFVRLTELSLPLLASDGWLLCFFHRFDRTRAEMEREVIIASGGELVPESRGTSGADIPETDPERTLRWTAFRLPATHHSTARDE